MICLQFLHIVLFHFSSVLKWLVSDFKKWIHKRNAHIIVTSFHIQSNTPIISHSNQLSINQSATTLYSANPNQNPFGGKSLDYVGGTDPNDKNYVKLTDALQEADTERRKAKEAAEARERAAEIRREERQRKIEYMATMPDSQPAGTGEWMYWFCFYFVFSGMDWVIFSC